MSGGKKHKCYTLHNRIELVKGGSSYFDRLKDLIQNARYCIYIRVYIWHDDETGRTIAEALINAAKRNVAVFVVTDGYASQGLPKEFIRNLKIHGIHFRYFEPLMRSTHFYFGRRLHEKIVSIDETIALVGGINFADRYNDIDATPAWLDYALLAEGEVAFNVFQYCYQQWENTPAVAKFIADEALLKENCSVRVRFNDWVKGKNQVWRTYFNWFNQAEEDITIICSYFLPGRVLRKRLGLAAKRGVKVKLILAGPSDVMLAKYAERYLYRWMLRNKIEIYEYQPSVLHAKMMVVDNRWITIGSFNVNNVSAYASMEVNFDVRNKPFAWSVQKTLDDIIEKDCIQVTRKSPVFNAGPFKQFIQKSSYELIRVILNLSTFYFKQE
ncbi:MAG TPA: phospholipase D-like domain-containing protein [Flavisolibacter sp.]|jgi:cardiolipin synthase|nr:phospholipase D-like domain-containing protein [Flavisolibacter sp.]